jgi:hypothetical protein
VSDTLVNAVLVVGANPIVIVAFVVIAIVDVMFAFTVVVPELVAAEAITGDSKTAKTAKALPTLYVVLLLMFHFLCVILN